MFSLFLLFASPDVSAAPPPSQDALVRAAVDSCNATQEFAEKQLVYIPLSRSASLCKGSGSLSCYFPVEEAEEMVAKLKVARDRWERFVDLTEDFADSADGDDRTWLADLQAQVVDPDTDRRKPIAEYEDMASTRCELR